ncbi:MAG: hypothetical protein JSW46_09875 [Gemmatimonadota bacterium]|nr:MAG: hypothetical protein JSW46_09875 [Gemmatimonadota bacterium]
MGKLTLIGLLAGAAVALAGMAQQREASCNLEVETMRGARSQMTTLPDGETRNDVWGGIEATCGSKWLRADSAVFFDRRGVLYLFWNIEYEDEGRTLVAERAIYYQDEDWVRAEGDVVLTDTLGGSTLSGPVLEYYPLNANRPFERIFAPGRPHLVYHAERAAAEEAAPFEVDADRIHIYGDSAIAGQGTVVAVRGDLTAYGDSMDLDLGSDELWLLGNPSVEAEETLLEGDSILIVLEESEVREIRAWPNGSARGSELSLTAPLLRMFIDGGEISRAVASAGAAERTGAVDSAGREPWARSISQDYVLTGDSIDIERPGGRLERVVAVESARAATVDRVLPGGEPLGTDWLEGDTITGYFAAAEPGDSAGEVALSRLEASGAIARALYHIYEETEEGEVATLPGVNYVIGRIVTLWLEEGEVQNARVVGPSTGIYLEPLPLATDGDSTQVPPDTAIVDTLRSVPDTTAAEAANLRGVG